MIIIAKFKNKEAEDFNTNYYLVHANKSVFNFDGWLWLGFDIRGQDNLWEKLI